MLTCIKHSLLQNYFNLFKWTLTSRSKNKLYHQHTMCPAYVNEYMKDHIFELWRKIWIYGWSSQLYTQLEQLWNLSLKKIQAWTGFEPMTSAILVQCSTEWATKPSGSWSHCEFVIYLQKVKNVNEYMKDHTCIFQLRRKIWIYGWSSQFKYMIFHIFIYISSTPYILFCDEEWTLFHASWAIPRSKTNSWTLKNSGLKKLIGWPSQRRWLKETLKNFTLPVAKAIK